MIPSTPERLCANEPEIASKIMDGEAILINLRTGAYYSLRDAGAVVWHLLRCHCTFTEIVRTVADRYDQEPASVELDLADLIGQLRAETLVRPSDRDRAIDSLDAAPAPGTPYRKPVLEKFTDMEELLALDPPTPGALDGLMRQPFGRRVP